MLKSAITLIILTLVLSGCNKLDDLLKDDERKVVYNVDLNNTPQNFEYSTTITYTGEDGFNKFDNHQSVLSHWAETGGDFSKGDRVSLAINTTLTRGTITLTIICKDCKNDDLINDRVIKTIDLANIKVGELSLNLE